MSCRTEPGADGKIVPFETVRRRDGAREFAAAAARLIREREAVAGVATRYLRDTPVEEWPRLAEIAELRNNTALEELSEEVRRRVDRDPAAALAVANLATSIAESLPPASYEPIIVAQIRATAWRDRANALRYLARYDEALQAADRAESLLQRFAGAVYDRALVQLVKAMVLAQMDHFEAAHTLVSGCREVLRDCGDTTRALAAGMVDANAFYRAGRYSEATGVYRELLQEAAAAGDVESQARLSNNLGYCQTHLGDFAAANIHFSDAIAKFTDLGYHSEIPRTERGAGLVLIGRGQVAAGLQRLVDARRAFTAAGMVAEAGLCALDIAAAHVERGDDAAARLQAQAVIDEFTAAGFDRCIIDPVTRLRDAIDVDSATAEAVRTAHIAIETLCKRDCASAR
jgi:tetratricopeptide (TPR) repeat protein